jgi:hypothetical protein
MLKKLIILGLSSLFALPAGAQRSSWPSQSTLFTLTPDGAVNAFRGPLAKQLSTQIGAFIVVDKLD